MKTTTAFRFIIAAMAAIPLLASCQKERADETPDTPAQTDEVRVITLQFANSTKTTLDSDGVTPKFENGDQILLSNGTDAPETATVSVAGGKATCPTKLKGTLTAVYPASSAMLNGNAIEGILVPTEQDGTFKSANICMATDIKKTSANFVNKTALLEITPPSGATSITIKSLKPVVDGVARTGTAKAINTEGNSAEDKLVIKVSVSGGKAYVSLVPGVIFSDLSFDAGETIGMKGIPTSKAGSGDAAAANTKYTIDGTNWHPYVTIGGKKWATMNIGANSSTEAGTYFAYADVTGQKPSGDTFATAFDWTHCPYTVHTIPTIFIKYVSPASDYRIDEEYGEEYGIPGYPGDHKRELDLVDDAAYVNWGGSWHIPVGAYGSDMTENMLDITIHEWTTESGVNGCKFTEVSSGKKLFFPAAGGGYGTSLRDAGSIGYYALSHNMSWATESAPSASLDDRVHYLPVKSGNEKQDWAITYRYVGKNVRPVSD